MPKTHRLLIKAPFRMAVLLLFCMLIAVAFFTDRHSALICKICLFYSFYLYLKNIKTAETNNLAHKIVVQYSRMKKIINNIPIAVYLKDQNGRILIANNGHEDIFGQNLGSLTGKRVSEIFKDCEDFGKEDRNIVKNKTCYEKTVKLSPKNSQKSTWIKVCKSPFYDENGKVRAIIVTMVNYDSYIESEKQKNTFVAGVTHDLKTPTNAQIKALDLLLTDKFGHLEQKQREIITEIKNSCRYMNSLIFSILDTYTAESIQDKMETEEFDFSKLVEESVSEISYLAYEKNQKLSFSLSEKELMVNADKTQIKRVIINLIANAVYYGRSNTVIEISVSGSSDAVFSVKNHSVYIPKEQLNSLFEKYKTASTRPNTGTGLGLYLSKQIILNHRGEIRAESSKDNICTFGFSIPLKPLTLNKNKIEMAS